MVELPKRHVTSLYGQPVRFSRTNLKLKRAESSVAWHTGALLRVALLLP
jgi:hypothetical protein